jgi:imidazolonepropionase
MRGCAIAPGLVDSHTHLPFFGWRADEFEARLAGRSYRDQHGEGGIRRSARMLSGAADEDVVAFCLRLLDEMLEHGTTTVELKTGYGLSVEAELRQARIGRTLSERASQTCLVTLLACHAVPDGMAREEWVATACEELIPRAAAEGLVDAVDVYVEDIAFTLEDLRAVAKAAAAAGLPLRCHADQLGDSGAAREAVALGARSADHLNHVSRPGIEALGGSAATVAVLLPSSTYTLRAPAAPAGALLDAGAAVAIATDFNPGTSPVLSMPQTISFACTMYGMTPAAAFGAATANAAVALGVEERAGTLVPGKRADLIVLDSEELATVPYRAGHNPVIATYVAGRLAWSHDPLALSRSSR